MPGVSLSVSTCLPIYEVHAHSHAHSIAYQRNYHTHTQMHVWDINIDSLSIRAFVSLPFRHSVSFYYLLS